jgi:hypothetical protein
MGVIGILASGGGGGGGSSGGGDVTTASITVDPITADDIVNAAEAAGMINVTGSVGGAAGPGDMVQFAVNGNPYFGTVAAGSVFSIAVSGADLAADTSFGVSVTGITTAGIVYSAIATSTHTVDTVASATITVDNITADDIVNAPEASGIINVTGSVGGDAAQGDVVSCTINGSDYMGTVVAGNTFSIPVSGNDLENDTSFDVTVAGTDNVGNPFSETTTSTHTVVTTAPVTAATALLGFDIKTFRFTWTDVSDATFYRLLENPDGSSGYSQVGTDVMQGTETIDHIVPLYKRINASYILQSCNTIGCTDGVNIDISGTLVDAIGYFKASNTDGGDRFGLDVSLSGDGSTLAVGAYGEDSNATGINGDEDANPFSLAGAVYVFVRSGSSWSQQAYLKASNTNTGDIFGWSVSLSADGNTLAVGAIDEGSNSTGVNGDQSNNSALQSGAAYVFVRSGIVWTQEAYLKASNTGANDGFGESVSLSADGNTLAIGAIDEDSNATGVNGNQNDNSALSSGAVYVFVRSGVTWSQQAYLKASNTDEGDHFAWSLAISGDGNTLAVGAFDERSNATGVNGNQNDNSAFTAGAVYVFVRSGTVWTQQAYIKASNTDAGDGFGSTVGINADGNTLAVGANETSNASGVNGNQGDNSALGAGAVYVYVRSGSNWSQQAYIKASNTDAGDGFGGSIGINSDGNTLAVGAGGESSDATGLDGNQGDNSAPGAGAVYVFIRSGATWSQQAYIKASNTEFNNGFASVSLSADGDTLVVGASIEDSNATGVGGDQNNNLAPNAGAAYVY